MKRNSQPTGLILVVSPHPDDAAFSVGATLGRLTQGGAGVTIVSCCTTSNWAPNLPRGLCSTDIRAVRVIEDRAFAEAIGATIVDLGHGDSSCRGYSDDNECQHRRVGDSIVEDIRRDLALIIERVSPDVVLAPAGIGAHIDHMATREAVLDLVGADSLAWYEDLPYAAALAPPVVAAALDQILGPAHVRVDLVVDPAVKRGLIEHYGSQVRHEERSALLQVKTGPLCERIWSGELIAKRLCAILASCAPADRAIHTRRR